MKDLRQFVTVARLRSISAAAKELHISQPALSRAIQKLEDGYGAALFLRNGAGMELSVFGQALYSRAVRVLPALEEAREEIQHLQGLAKAAIRIATGDLWGLVILPAVIRQFAVSHPDVVVHVEIADESARLQGLRNGVFDVVFGTMSEQYTPVVSVQFQPMIRQATYVYCDRHHPLAGQEVSDPELLLRHRWVNPGYDDNAAPGILGRQPRDFAARVDTIVGALLILRGSPFLMSASSGFVHLFHEFGLERVGLADAGRGQDSGAIHQPHALDRPVVRDFLRLARQNAMAVSLPDPRQEA